MLFKVTEMHLPTADEVVQKIKNYTDGYAGVVPFDKQADGLLLMNFTESNLALSPLVLGNTTQFSEYVSGLLFRAHARYGIGGYNEHRGIYQRSAVFDGEATSEPRRLHLGVDIWGPANVPVFAPLPATVHSVGYNGAYGDYGATLILQHELEGMTFYTLYGHLSRSSMEDKKPGAPVDKGAWIAYFGQPAENGNWPPHLHFQVIIDMEGKVGDYPGVCALSEKEHFLSNCPDADLILNLVQYAQP